jgi:hypothetical protein
LKRFDPGMSSNKRGHYFSPPLYIFPLALMRFPMVMARKLGSSPTHNSTKWLKLCQNGLRWKKFG